MTNREQWCRTVSAPLDMPASELYMLSRFGDESRMIRRHGVSSAEKELGQSMRVTNTFFGGICLLTTVLVIYGLLFYKLYVFWTKGIWVDWMLGNFLPDEMIVMAFSLKASIAREIVVWTLSQDILIYFLPFPLLVFYLDQRMVDAD